MTSTPCSNSSGNSSTDLLDLFGDDAEFVGEESGNSSTDLLDPVTSIVLAERHFRTNRTDYPSRRPAGGA
jgi:hypothetical protein